MFLDVSIRAIPVANECHARCLLLTVEDLVVSDPYLSFTVFAMLIVKENGRSVSVGRDAIFSSEIVWNLLTAWKRETLEAATLDAAVTISKSTPSMTAVGCVAVCTRLASMEGLWSGIDYLCIFLLKAHILDSWCISICIWFKTWLASLKAWHQQRLFFRLFVSNLRNLLPEVILAT